MKRWRVPAASRARYRRYAHACLPRGEIASTLADRSRATKTITRINRRWHQDQHSSKCDKHKQAGLDLLRHFFTFGPSSTRRRGTPHFIHSLIGPPFAVPNDGLSDLD
jgi:hypothetical protein